MNFSTKNCILGMDDSSIYFDKTIELVRPNCELDPNPPTGYTDE
jgi:hypothetical protein